MNAPPVDPSSATTAKEPEAKPMYSDESVTITDRAVIIAGKQYSLSEIKDVSIHNWQEIVCQCCLVAAVGFYAFGSSWGYYLHLPWKPDHEFTRVYGIFFLLSMVFGAWSSSASRLVFTLPTGKSVVSQGKGRGLKKIKAEVDRARIAATPTAPAGPPDNTNRPG